MYILVNYQYIVLYLTSTIERPPRTSDRVTGHDEGIVEAAFPGNATAKARKHYDLTNNKSWGFMGFLWIFTICNAAPRDFFYNI